METLGSSVIACRLCQHYRPEGRRGGICRKLDVPVAATWEACSLASHPFELSWQSANNINSFLKESLQESLIASEEEFAKI
jgi:hypothetical protein